MKRVSDKAAVAEDVAGDESDGEPATYIPVHQRRLLKIQAARASRKKGKVDDGLDADQVKAAAPPAAVSMLDMAIREGRVRDSTATAAEEQAESVRAEEREIVEVRHCHHWCSPPLRLLTQWRRRSRRSSRSYPPKSAQTMWCTPSRSS